MMQCACNTLDTMASISAKGYPNYRWEPLLSDRVAKWGGPLEALHAALSPTTSLAQSTPNFAEIQSENVRPHPETNTRGLKPLLTVPNNG